MRYSQCLLSRRRGGGRGGGTSLPARKSHSKSQRRPASGDTQLRQATVEAGQVPSEPHQATPSDAREVTGVKGSPVQIRPSRLVINFFRIYLHLTRANKRAIPLAKWPFQRRAPRSCHGVLPGHWPRRQSQAGQPVKGSKITQPPRTGTATPGNCEPADTIPAHRLTTGRTPTGVHQLQDTGKPANSR